MKYTVKTPSNTFRGKRAGIHFSNGEAVVTDEALIPVFRELGYEIEAADETPKPAAKKPAARKKREVE